MPFSERIKQEARKKAAFQCCICKRSGLSLEVHHIIPESPDGPSDIENAIVLCSSCHAIYGANPEKRKMMKQCRDDWYDKVDRMYGQQAIDIFSSAFEIHEQQLSNLSSEVNDLKTRLREYMNQSINEMEITPETVLVTVSEFINASTLYQPKSDRCVKCGYMLRKTDLYCPHCGEPTSL
ncbi:MAG TPA: HNH endonuclease [Methanomicrobia archaeon]|nr:HNH endonuclease [Methanomicrobia archaeon]